MCGCEVHEGICTYGMHKPQSSGVVQRVFNQISLVAVCVQMCVTSLYYFNILHSYRFIISDILESPLTFAEWLSARPRPVGEADPLCRAVQCVTDCTGEAHFAAHFKVARLSAGMGRCAGIPAVARRIACNGR